MIKITGLSELEYGRDCGVVVYKSQIKNHFVKGDMNVIQFPKETKFISMSFVFAILESIEKDFDIQADKSNIKLKSPDPDLQKRLNIVLNINST